MRVAELEPARVQRLQRVVEIGLPQRRELGEPLDLDQPLADEVDARQRKRAFQRRVGIHHAALRIEAQDRIGGAVEERRGGRLDLEAGARRLGTLAARRRPRHRQRACVGHDLGRASKATRGRDRRGVGVGHEVRSGSGPEDSAGGAKSIEGKAACVGEDERSGVAALTCRRRSMTSCDATWHSCDCRRRRSRESGNPVSLLCLPLPRRPGEGRGPSCFSHCATRGPRLLSRDPASWPRGQSLSLSCQRK
jgi:hypothetical protein